MRLAVFGKNFSQNFHPALKEFFSFLLNRGDEIFVYAPFMDFIKEQLGGVAEIDGAVKLFDKELPGKLDFLFSIGGDGTFLEAASMLRGSDVPMLGINSGRLGFLAYIAKEDIVASLGELFSGRYTQEERSMLELSFTGVQGVRKLPALNEIAIQKVDSRMLTIHAYLNGELLNSYWADGLIVATPTGSTAYSLSVGGPIVIPGSRNFIISPISPHTLAVRPVVVPDDQEIKLKVESRSEKYIASADFMSQKLDRSVELTIKRSKETVKTVMLDNHNFYSVIRSKLMWGVDKRN